MEGTPNNPDKERCDPESDIGGGEDLCGEVCGRGTAEREEQSG